MALKWLDRSLVDGPHLTLVLDDRDLIAVAKHFKVDVLQLTSPSDTADGWTATLQHPRFGLAAVVVLRSGHAQRPLVEVFGLLVHEAVHVWQLWRDVVGEKEPGSEHEAYSIQGIAQRLMCRYEEATRKARSVTKVRRPAGKPRREKVSVQSSIGATQKRHASGWAIKS